MAGEKKAIWLELENCRGKYIIDKEFDTKLEAGRQQETWVKDTRKK